MKENKIKTDVVVDGESFSCTGAADENNRSKNCFHTIKHKIERQNNKK